MFQLWHQQAVQCEREIRMLHVHVRLVHVRKHGRNTDDLFVVPRWICVRRF